MQPAPVPHNFRWADVNSGGKQTESPTNGLHQLKLGHDCWHWPTVDENMFYIAIFLGLFVYTDKRCGYGVEGASSTAHCVASCSGRQNGDYASCHGCRFFATCVDGAIFDRRLCPSNLIWDNKVKDCRTRSSTCRVKQVSCMTTCQGIEDGDYHSCTGCHVFASCVEGKLYDNRQCPGQLQWDDVKKRCVRVSATCARLMNVLAKEKNGETTEVETSMAPTPRPTCIDSCTGLLDGNYQSCLGCTVFASCKNEVLVDNRPCSPGLVWDDDRKTCNQMSSTCTAGVRVDTVEPGTCVKSCADLREGLYQSCRGCRKYARCLVGRMIETLMCPSNRVWDDFAKECLKHSTTCFETGPKEEDITEEGIPTESPGTCVSSCEKRPDGFYQSCHGCSFFATCSNGILRDLRPCAEGQVWDDRQKRCAPSSSTCGGSYGNCVHSCAGVTNGKYQSCRGCDTFVTCQHGIISQDIPCPHRLVWDDDLKLCVHVSSTCNYGKRQDPLKGDGNVSVKVEEKVKEENDSVQEKQTEVPTVETSTDTTATTASTVMTVVNGTTALQTSCISSCEGMADGNYQSCFGCKTYITCSNGVVHDRHCPGAQSWDANLKQCSSSSSTCGPGFGGCVEQCGSLLDGNYQSCKGCHLYVTCSNGEAHDNRPCPIGLIWDDLRKWCVAESATCRPVGELAKPICVTACEGLADGDYQSCKGCHFYVTCSNEEFIDSRPCPNGLKFDSTRRRCAKQSTTCGPGHGECVESCVGLENGDYQSCHGCQLYATCTAGVLIDQRPCHSGLVWDDNRKRCVQYSDTCSSQVDPDVIGSGGGNLRVTGVDRGNGTETFEFEGHVGDGVCMSSCAGQLNGDYQSCTGCDVYVSCLRYKLFVRSCPEGLVWDDTIKHCMSTSPTCAPGRGGCVSSCEGVADGDHQSCHGCRVYVSCHNGVTMDDRPCPGRAVWDDQRKRCEQTSVTCPGTGSGGVTPGVCVLSCEGRPDGDYQSCRGCSGYVSCIEGVLHENLPCPASLLWDDKKKRCRKRSSTCGPGKGQCVQSCDGLPDGDFASCHGCHVYVTCLHGVLHDDRPCPHRLVWDTTNRRCMPTSPTCPSGFARTANTGLTGAVRASASHVQTFASSCIDSCEGLADGDYQSCHDCRVFASCLNGVLNDDRPCPVHTVWDDNLKRCMRVSATCSSAVVLVDRGDDRGRSGAGVAWRSSSVQGVEQQPSMSLRTSAASCIQSCDGLPDGNYQSCHDCRVYVSCLAGETHDDRPCPGRAVWDDLRKRCLRSSSTCTTHNSLATTTRTVDRRRHHHQTRPVAGSRSTGVTRPASCVSSCEGRSDGDYQSCHDCRVYVTCRGGQLHDDRACPTGTLWDDLRKRCLATSATCRQAGDLTHVGAPPGGERHRSTDGTRGSRGSVLGRCITSCVDLPDGDYQSCNGCAVYVSCIRGNLFDNRKCPIKLLWDDRRKRCRKRSSTCTSSLGVCVETCEGRQDGDYQSCSGCRVYATCFNGIITDNRPCPSGTKWDDNLKRCLWFSITCRL